ncbi:MAG: ATP-binding protein [Bacteroidetes bacterium]|nr:ATP-binding protein [Bacteroidota bacterium]
MIYKITLTGTESTGKSTLAEKLSIHYKTIHVPDYSRYYIGQLERAYAYTDVMKIAEEIIEQENNMIRQANKILFSDNDLINIKIWLQYYRWDVPQWLNDEIKKRKSDLYLLCDIDLPWMPDPQRSNPNDRTELFNEFSNELNALNANFKFVSGALTDRTEIAIAHIDTFLINQ